MKMKNDQVLYWREAKAMLKAKVSELALNNMMVPIIGDDQDDTAVWHSMYQRNDQIVQYNEGLRILAVALNDWLDEQDEDDEDKPDNQDGESDG